MSLKDKVQTAVERGDSKDLEMLISLDPRVVRYLVGLSYHPEAQVRQVAAEAIGTAAMHHPRLVSQVVRRLIWAMNDESGTNALTAPDVILAIARARSELLLPMVPDLLRHSTDEGLHDRLAQALQIIKAEHPGGVGDRLRQDMYQRFHPEDRSTISGRRRRGEREEECGSCGKRK